MVLTSVKKAFKILDVFGIEDIELGVADISRHTGMHKSAVSRILMALASSGYLERNGSNKKYRLSWKLVNLGNIVLSRYSDIRVAAGLFLEELAKRTDEIVHLGIMDKNEVVHLERKGRDRALTIGSRVGGRTLAHGSALGKVLMSNLTREELLANFGPWPLMRLTKKTICEFPDLLKELRKVKKQGFAFDDEECHEGIRCVSAPIKDNKGTVIFAISVSAPKHRMRKRRREKILPLVLETAQLISKQISINTT